eukprot:gene8460-11440_t
MSKKDELNCLIMGVGLSIASACAVYLAQWTNSKSNEKSPSKLFIKSPDFYASQENDSDADSSEGWISLGLEQPLVMAMVGLPARGKSYLVKMIMRYLKWIGFECKVFNVGSYRRQIGLQSADSKFFDTNNADANKVREDMAMAVQDSMYQWLSESKDFRRRVAIFDATNTTRARRAALSQRAKSQGVFLLYVESICDDQDVLKRNYSLKLQNEDYKSMDSESALKDFMSRVTAYEKVYESIEDTEDNSNISYIKLINVGQKVITRNCTGFLPSQVAFYLQNVHIQPRKIYLSLSAENLEHMENLDSRLSGVTTGILTEEGTRYTTDLADFIKSEQSESLVELGKEVLILTGTAKIHLQTVSQLHDGFSCFHTPILNELRAGDFHGLSKDEVKKLYPKEYDKRMQDKLHYRYPGVGGESYLDVIERVRPLIIELERQRRSILVVCHLAVLRCIYAYFMGVPLQDIPFKSFEAHHIYELTPGPFGCTCSVIDPTQRHESSS